MKENNALKRILAGVLAGGTLLLSSCGLIEMRDSEVDDGFLMESTGEASSMLAPAERKNTIGTSSIFEQSEVTVKTPAADGIVTLAFTGDVLIDGSIIKDAANRAADGKSYSFLRMYAGIFSRVNGADVAFGSYSAAKNPTGDSDITHKTPVESLAALSDLGYDLLDTTEAGDLTTVVGEYDIDGLSADTRADDNIRLVERDGLTFAYLAMGDKSHRHSYVKATMTDNIGYADLAADVVIVSVNWENGLSAEKQREIAVEMAELGADVIIGDGDWLGSIEWLDTGDGAPALFAYSLGNLLSSSDSAAGLCSGVLTFDVSRGEHGAEISNVSLTPAFVHYISGKKDYQIFELPTYTDELAVQHAIPGVSCDGLLSHVRGTVPAEFLTPEVRGY